MNRNDFIRNIFFGCAALIFPKYANSDRSSGIKKGGTYPFGLIKDGKLLSIEDVRQLKLDAVKKQDFELAVKLRTVERRMLRIKDVQYKSELRPPSGKYISLRDIRDIRKYTNIYNNGLD